MIDYGCDPIGDGMYRMVPSGDIVDYEEMCIRLPRIGMDDHVSGLIFGRTWEQIQAMQRGGKK